MKRGCEGESSRPKRARTEESNFSLALRRSFRYISERTKIDKPPGHLSAVVRMVYDLETRFSLILGSLVPDRNDIQLEVVLSRLHLESLAPLRIGDKVQLLLKGARIEKIKKQHYLPVKLVFTEGYHIRFGDNEINTFVGPAPKLVQGTSTAVPRPVEDQEKRRRSTEPPNQKAPEAPAPQSLPNAPNVQRPPADASSVEVLRPPGEYASIKSLHTKAKKLASVIGVVLRVDEAKLCRGGDKDWMRYLRITDCTDFNADAPPQMQGITFNLFATGKAFLPDPEVGDIIILNQVWVSPFNDTVTAVGYARKYQWAIYSKENRLVHHGDGGRPAPTFPHTFPFYTATPTDITYCERLLAWWLEVNKKQQEEADGTRVEPVTYRWKRTQKLIGDLETPGANTAAQYFDCTVEVLHKFPSDNGIFTIWVTDYTKIASGFPVDGEWCPSQLIPYAFRIEMWDGAALLGLKMKEHSFYSLRNVRARLNPRGYLEGKLVETKIAELDEATDQSESLKALLVRRKAVEVETGPITNNFQDKLVSEATVERFFHCTVEILHAEYQEDKASTVYCSDYTLRKDLGGIPSQAPWAKGLENRIAKFLLYDGQSIIAQSVKPGDVCRFNKIRLRKDQKHGYLYGHLGGHQELMEKLNPKNKENKPLQDLFRRKESLATNLLPSSTFQEIINLGVWPEKFRVSGHVVAYEPKNMDGAIAMRCTPCNRQLGVLEKMCIACESNEGLEPLCNLFLTVEDKDMNRVLVRISEKSLVFQNMDLSTFLDDLDVRTEFRECLRPIVGDFYPEKSDIKELNGPMLSMDVIVWSHDGDVAFSLINAKFL